MDPLLDVLMSTNFTYAGHDERAAHELAQRVAVVGGAGEFLTYSQLARGVVFEIETVKGGQPFKIDTNNWEAVERSIIGSFLGNLCAQTYRRGGFMGSALVVGKVTRKPNHGFWTLMRDIGTLRGMRLPAARA